MYLTFCDHEGPNNISTGSVWKLDLAQSALLAGLPQAPSEYNPFLNPNLARTRRQNVLQAMVQSHYITRAQAAAANAEPLQARL